MKIFSFLLLLLTAFSIHALQVINLGTGSETTDSVLTAPEKDVEYTDDGIIVTYKFRNIGIEEDDIHIGTYRFELPGFRNVESPGKPATPYAVESFLVPSIANPYTTVAYGKYIDLKYDVSPGRIPLPANDTIGYSESIVPKVEPYSGLWPYELCECIESALYRKQQIYRVAVNPVQYDYASGIVRIYTELTYKINFNGSTMDDVYLEPGSLLNPNSTLKPKGIAHLAMNADSASYREPGTSVNADAGYLIVSVPEFKSTLYEFVKWKKRLGYRVTELYDDSWTPEKVKDAVKTQYESDSTLMYLLIVGDNEKVPGKKEESPTNDGYSISDLQYGCMDGDNDFDPDIYRGRWPVSYTTDLQAIIDKTMWYEQAPPIDDQFYSRASHFAPFVDGNKNRDKLHDGIEDRRYVKNCEDVRDYLSTFYGYDVDRFYNVDTLGLRFWPNMWNPNYSAITAIPADLLHKNGYSWNYGATDLIDAVNDGVSYILFSGHGGYDAWGDGNNVLFDMSDVKRMENQGRLPIVFSIACSTGKHDEKKGCLINAFLSEKKGGAVGAFAHTGISYTIKNDRLISALFNAIWPSPGFLDPKLNFNIAATEPKRQLGAIIDFGILGYSNSDIDLYSKRVNHCFGDPSMYFRTETPEILDGKVDVQHTGRGTHVSVYDKDAYIAFYDPIKDKSTRYYGNEAAYFTDYEDGGKYVDVVVYTPNSVPVIVYGEDYFGEITEPTEESRIVGYHDPYNHSRVDIKYYLNSKDAKKSVEMLIVDLATNNIISSAPVDKSITNQVTSINMRCHGGVMVASLMIDGYPVSNMKMYISK